MKTQKLTVYLVDQQQDEFIRTIESEEELLRLFPNDINASDLYTIDQAVYVIDEVSVKAKSADGLSVEIYVHSTFYGMEEDFDD